MSVDGVGQNADYGSMHDKSGDAVPDKLTKVRGELQNFLKKIGVETTGQLDEANIAIKVNGAYNKYYVAVDKGGNISFKEKALLSKLHSAIGLKEATGLKEVFKNIQKLGVKEMSESDLETYKLLANVTNTIVERSLKKSGKPELTAKLETLKLQTQTGFSGVFNTSLYNAFKTDDQDAIRQLLENGADINGKDKDGKTMLHLAVVKDDLKLINRLYDAGADMSCKDNSGNTLLHLAAQRGGDDLLEELIEMGVSASDKNDEGRNPLHIAAEYGNADAVTTLIDPKSIDIESEDNDGMTPLCLAVQNGRLEAVEELLGCGAKTDSVINGETLLALARRKGFPEIAGLLRLA